MTRIKQLIKRLTNNVSRFKVNKGNELDILARKYGTDKRTNDDGQSHYHGYVEIYHRLFKDRRNEYKHFLEIGVREGWSHKMWHDYFPNAMIYGVDNFSDVVYKSINFKKEEIENERIKIFVGDQSDPLFLEESFKNIAFDVIIDDGSHRSWHQQLSFKYLFPKLKSGGLYIIEDLGVCSIREFREYDDVRSATTEWLKSIQKREFFSYYMNAEESKIFSAQIKSVKIIGELGIIVKN
jgi:hypothetical protein